MMLHPTYPISSERLALRPFTHADLDDVHAYHSLDDVVRYLYWVPHDRAGSSEALAQKIGQTTLANEGDRLTIAVEWPEAARVIGEVNLMWRSREHRQGEIGYVFNPEFHGCGFATEAAREMLRLGFDVLGLHRMFGRCDARNEPSARVMERLGMRREAHFVHDEMFKGEWGDTYVYAMLAAEWPDHR
jgi:RimJ/RimL family protein N-acetyltransferase